MAAIALPPRFRATPPSRLQSSGGGNTPSRSVHPPSRSMDRGSTGLIRDFIASVCIFGMAAAWLIATP